MLAGDLEALERLVHAASAIKAELIARDPYEEDSRRTLGFGHALAHPLETVTGYGELLHGEAVAFGMVVEAPHGLGPRPARRFDRSSASSSCCGASACRPTRAELPARIDGERLLAASSGSA